MLYLETQPHLSGKVWLAYEVMGGTIRTAFHVLGKHERTKQVIFVASRYYAGQL